MKKISLWLFIFTFTVCTVRGQEDATQQQIDQLSGQIQTILATQVALTKRMDALEKQVSDLSDKINQPPVNNYATQDDLKKIADQLQELAEKQQHDNDVVVKEFENLSKIGGGSTSSHKSPTVSTGDSTPTTSGPQTGYEYQIAPGDTLSAISKAYRAQGVKVSVEQILKANPGLDPKSLIVGKKIFIPAPK